MISLTFTLSNITQILQVFNRIQVQRYIGEGIPQTPVSLVDYTTISGVDQISNISDVSEVILMPQYGQYYLLDPAGDADSWYISRYYNSNNGSSSSWSDPILGDPEDLFVSPFFPPEIEYGSADQMVINRIRLLIGDPVGLRREFGSEAESSIMPDGKTYVLDSRGWPCSISMNGIQYTETSNPTVNGYRYLRFKDYIDIPNVTISGARIVEQGVDIWIYEFRWSDREIMSAYSACPPPVGLTTTTANAECYMVATALDLLGSETWEAISETGVILSDDRSRFDVSPGMRLRGEMLDKLKARLDALTRSLLLTGIQGVLLD